MSAIDLTPFGSMSPGLAFSISSSSRFLFGDCDVMYFLFGQVLLGPFGRDSPFLSEKPSQMDGLISESREKTKQKNHSHILKESHLNRRLFRETPLRFLETET
jgi:hypothetical protein